MPIYECYVDGAARGAGVDGVATGEGACAAVFFKNRKSVGQYARLLGHCTNTHAEYEAVIMAAMMCWAAGFDDPIIYSDSEPVVYQINGKYSCDNPRLKPLLMSIKEISSVFRFRVVHVPRSHVSHADELANRLLDNLEKEKQMIADRRPHGS